MSDIDWSAVYEQYAPSEEVLRAVPKTLELPALSGAVSKFVERSRDPETTARDLALIVETDAGLTMDLLRYVNSSAFGLTRPARSVQQAIALLGLKKVKGFVISSGTQSAVRARASKLINQQCFWNASLQKALFAREMAIMLGADDDVAFSAGLLQDFLLPILTTDYYDQYYPFVSQRSEMPLYLTEFEKQQLKFDHTQLGATLLRQWQLPDEMACCLLLHHRGLRILADPVLKRTSVAAVAISALLPDQLRQCYAGLEQLVLLQEKWPKFDLGAMVDRVDEQHESIAANVKNDFPLARRCRPALEKAASEAALETGNAESEQPSAGQGESRGNEIHQKVLS